MTAILYLHNKTAISGGEQSLLNLWRNLDHSRFAPILVIPGDGPFAAEARGHGISVEFCPVPKLTPFNVAAILKTIATLTKLCRKYSARLIHSYTPRNNLVAWAVSRWLRIPVIWHERNMLFGLEPDVSKRFIALPDCIICNSDAVANRFGKKGQRPAKVKTVINGVEVNRFHPGPPLVSISGRLNPRNRKVVGLISNLSKRKGADRFLDIAAMVVKKYPEVEFLIVGGEFGDLGENRRSIIEEKAVLAGLGDRLRITGFVSNVHEIIPLFDVGVAVTEKEACSRAILEMMACEKPVVAFDTGGNPELIEHESTGLLFTFGAMEPLANGIVGLLKDPAASARLGDAARKRVEARFDVTRNAHATMEIYDHLLKGGRF